MKFTITADIRPTDQHYINNLVNSGRYASPEEAVGALISEGAILMQVTEQTVADHIRETNDES